MTSNVLFLQEYWEPHNDVKREPQDSKEKYEEQYFKAEPQDVKAEYEKIYFKTESQDIKAEYEDQFAKAEPSDIKEHKYGQGNWLEHKAPDNRPYFYNVVTPASSVWEKHNVKKLAESKRKSNGADLGPLKESVFKKTKPIPRLMIN